MPQSEEGDAPPDLEAWGGVECSHIRIGHAERDQCAETGHLSRPDDIDLIARLGIRVLRHPMV